MKTKILWVGIGCLLMLALLASCGPAQTPSTTTPSTTTTTPAITTTPPSTTPSKLAEKPQYGGTYVTVHTNTPLDWDPAAGSPVTQDFYSLTNERLAIGDWAKGPGGSNEDSFFYLYLPEDHVRGALAESWERPDPLTIIFHLRKGVHWQNKPPVNGEEFTANDVVTSFERYMANKALGGTTTKYIESVTATDRYTVVMKANTPHYALLEDQTWGTMCVMQSKTMVEARNNNISNWKDVVGTGPFILTDYVTSSSVTYERNPNYWGYDELHPENRLPYVDEVRILIIQDKATELAALRAGKIDSLFLVQNITADDVDSLRTTNPKLNFLGKLSPAAEPAVFFNTTKPPFDDIRVRKALSMAIDRQAVIDKFYKGYAGQVLFPMLPDWKEAATMAELPQETQEQFEYNPERAKQLLSEAGYPNGFNTKITGWVYREEMELMATYWAQIGVNVEVNISDVASALGKMTSRTYEGMAATSYGMYYPYSGPTYQTSNHPYNFSGYQDPVYDKMMDDIVVTMDSTERIAKYKELHARFLSQIRVCNWPVKYLWTVWQPWLNGYHGELMLGPYQRGGIIARSWLNLDLKKEMTR